MPREAGQQNQRAARAARLPDSYDRLFDTIRVRTAYRCRAYPGEAAAAGAEPHLRLRPRGVEPDPGRPARPLAGRARRAPPMPRPTPR